MTVQPTYDFLIVGAGLYGAVFAREMTNAGKRCLVVDKRSHIAGNAYSKNQDGIEVHVYGPHIFHTNDKAIWDYVNQFAEFIPYHHRVNVTYKGESYSFPINLKTLQQVFGVNTEEEAKVLLEKLRTPTNEKDLESWVIGQVGQELYEIFVKGYTQKQWGRDPKNLPNSIIKRIPIRTNHNENYFDDRYQGIPRGGYTKLVANMLHGIDVQLETDYLEKKNDLSKLASQILFTGPIDAYFDYQLGALEYRGLRFETSKIEKPKFQATAAVNYTELEVPYTRIVEHQQFEPKGLNHTIITKEYPLEWTKGKEPYYPINDDKNKILYNAYRKLAEKETNVIFGGRLGEYKYYDMHQVIAASLKTSREIIKESSK